MVESGLRIGWLLNGPHLEATITGGSTMNALAVFQGVGLAVSFDKKGPSLGRCNRYKRRFCGGKVNILSAT